MSARRIVSIWLPRLPLERWERQRKTRGASPSAEDAPLALTVEGRHGPVVHALNRAAEALGLRIGARLVDCRALCPELMAEDADLSGDAAALERLAHWCRRWCPWTAADGAGGMMLDASGSTHLWGGEAAMLEDMRARLAALGLSARLAVAPTWGAAWALARFSGRPISVCPGKAVEAMLAPLSVQCLRLGDDMVTLLRRLGLRTVGALAAAPRLSLARRFAKDLDPEANPLARLDQAFGRSPEPVTADAERPTLRIVRRLAEPAMDAAPFLEPLTEQLCRKLEDHGLGARRLRLSAYRVDGDIGTIEAATSRPGRDPTHLVRLFEGKLDALDPGFGFDAVALEASVAEPLGERQARLSGEEESELQLARLIDRLSARLGPGAVTRPVARESHVPERSEAWVSALECVSSKCLAQPECPSTPERPIRLLGTPEAIRVLYAVPEGPPARFVWRRRTHRIVRHEGPERIAPEWWRERSVARLRDYYRVEDEAGRRYWLFREGLHGDGRGGAPRWFLHGLFA